MIKIKKDMPFWLVGFIFGGLVLVLLLFFLSEKGVIAKEVFSTISTIVAILIPIVAVIMMKKEGII